MSKLDNYYHLFIHWLQANPEWGLVATFFVALSESLPLIGTIIPGSVMMTTIGILVGNKILPLPETLFAATIGAICGDSVGFLFGYFYHKKLKKIWPLKNHPEWLERGRLFLEEHGGKSIFIGRFIGVIRPIVPLIAGALQMSPVKFYIIDIISAILWSIVYMLPGYLIGTAASLLPPNMEKKIIIGLIVILIVIWLTTWLFRLFYRQVNKYFNATMDHLWGIIHQHPRWRIIQTTLRFPEQQHHSGQLALACLWLITTTLFIFFVIINTIWHSAFFSELNNIIYHLLRSLNYPLITRIAILITTLGQAKIIIPTAIIVFIYLLYRKQWRTAYHWGILTISTSGSLLILKQLIYKNYHPLGFMQGIINSPFPNSHVTLVVALYGFIAYLITLHYPQKLKLIWRILIVIYSLVVLSCLYLYTHWVSDTIAATLLGLIWLFLIIISHRRQRRTPLNGLYLLITTLIAFAICASYYWYRHYPKIFNNYQLSWSHYHIDESQWWQKQNNIVPLYHSNRLGHPDQLLNIQWADNLNKIKSILITNHWQLLSVGYFTIFYKRHIAKKTYLQAMVTKRNKGKLPALVAIKHMPADQIVILYLWSANIDIVPKNIPLWIGNIYKMSHHSYHFWHHDYSHINNQIPTLIETIKHDYTYKVITINARNLPKVFTYNQSNMHYKIILIKPNKINGTTQKNE